MKCSLTYLLSGALLVLGSAVAQDSYAYDDFDANGDGSVAAGEFNDTYGSDLYGSFDADADGSVTQDEFGGGVYSLYDADDNGTLSEDEYDAGVEVFYDGDYDALSNRAYDGTYEGLDADDNGEVSEAEFTNAYDPASLYGSFDADADGQLGETEFNEGVFGVVDDNSDGAFSEDEYNAAPLLFGSAGGDVAGGGVSRSRDTTFNAEDYEPFGDVQVGAYEPLEGGAEGGALSLAYSSPNAQNVDFNVTGPNGYREDFEVGYIGLETGGDVRTIGGLEPGVYSVAATDDNLQLIETKVEVREGERVLLNFNMQLLEDFEYTLADYAPYGAYEVGAYEPIDAADYGNLSVTVNTADGNAAVAPNINVTGPDDYRRELEGGATLQALVEGPYSVAATAPGYRMAEGKVDIRVGEVAQVTLTLEPLGDIVNNREISGEAAGGMPVEAPVQALAQSGGAAQGGGTSLILIETRSPGSYIADTEGMTLYTLVDEAMQPLPCDAQCLSTFPALTGDVSLGGEGGTTLDASLLGTVDAADGTSQVTYNGYPLHYYSLDQNPGDLEAQSMREFEGTWYVLAGNPPSEPLESDPLTGEDAD